MPHGTIVFIFGLQFSVIRFFTEFLPLRYSDWHLKTTLKNFSGYVQYLSQMNYTIKCNSLGKKEVHINLWYNSIIHLVKKSAWKFSDFQADSLGAGDRTWTGTEVNPRDFKSLVSADSTTAAKKTLDN